MISPDDIPHHLEQRQLHALIARRDVFYRLLRIAESDGDTMDADRYRTALDRIQRKIDALRVSTRGDLPEVLTPEPHPVACLAA